jgi:hypothetical protein
MIIRKAADQRKTSAAVKGGLFPMGLCFLLVCLAACSNVFQGVSGPDGGDAAPARVLTVKLAGDDLVQVNPSHPVLRTMLPTRPVFTRYQLVFTDGSSYTSGHVTPPVPLLPEDPLYHAPVDFFNSITHIPLDDGTYYCILQGYVGDAVAARSVESAAVTVTGGVVSPGTLSFTLNPYEAPEEEGTLAFSLSWEGLDRMPSHAALEITTNSAAAPDTWTPISAQYIVGAGLAHVEGAPETILLLRNDGVSEAYSALSGSISLPPGEYKLKVNMALDGGTVNSGDMDIAHIYSNLTTPAAFHYGAGRFTAINEAADPSAPFITSFEFAEARGTTVIGSTAGADGTRLIMVMVPPSTDLTGLTPLVTTAPGSSITFPVAASVMFGGSGYGRGEIDFTNPSSWTVQSTSGAVQRYTVVVSKSAEVTGSITYFSFKEFPNNPGVIDQSGGTINITLPAGTAPALLNDLTPEAFFMGPKVVYWDGTDETDLSSSPAPKFDFSSPRTFRVYNSDNSTYKTYTVTTGITQDNDAEITTFTIDGYGTTTFTVNGTLGTIKGTLPYGVSLAQLTPIIQYKGKTLSPPSRQSQDFRFPVHYTVTAADGTTTKSYEVILDNDPPNRDTRIADFSIANVSGCDILIGTNPRAGDGKIPIIVQVPYGININSFIPVITLASSLSTIALDPPDTVDGAGGLASGEHSYTVTAQATNTQQYAVTISAKGGSYYVNGATGIDDNNADAGSQARPFKTLAWAVDKTANHPTINRIVVSGELNNTTEGGAWEDNDTSPTRFHANGSTVSSVFTLYGTNGKQITITGGTLRGVSGKRVLYVNGGANLVFENTNITGGSLPGASLGIGGGGIYIAGGSKVKFTGGSISNNSAPNGGGVYLDDADFTLMGGSIISNNATLQTGWAGGGGVSVNGRSVFWMANGTIANNVAAQDGAGVQVYGQFNGFEQENNGGFIMSGGVITGNRGLYCGGVYISSGEFEMTGGEISLNRTNAATNGAGLYALIRDGGIVIDIRGDASINNNSSDFAENKEAGTVYQGNRNIAFNIGGNARVNTAYVDVPGVTGDPSTGFNLTGSARLGTVFLNYNANPPVVVDLLGTDTQKDRIAILDLTGTLATWVNKPVLTGSAAELDRMITDNRFRLYNNGNDITATHYLARSGNTAVLRTK